MNIPISDVVAPVAGAGVFLLLSYPYLKAIRRDKPLTPFMRGLLLYGFFFILGLGYLMLAIGDFDLPPSVLWVGGPLWGGVIIFVVWWRHRRKSLSE